MANDIPWIKSSYSANGANCVEVGKLDEAVVLRDSTDPDGPVLQLTHGQWAAFLDALKAGAFDRPSAAAPLSGETGPWRGGIPCGQ